MKNRFEIVGEVTYIYLRAPKGLDLKAIIDTNDLEKVASISGSWGIKYDEINNSYYARAASKRDNRVYMHRVIMSITIPKMHVDHTDHNTLNNRKGNLRIVTNAENQQNIIGARKNSKHGVLGVTWKESRQKWLARIKVNQKHIHLGYFINIEEAKEAVRKARAKHMPYSQEALQLHGEASF